MSRATKYTGVYQRCQQWCPQRCSAHSYGYRVELGNRADGRRDQRTKEGYATAAEAQDARAEVVRQHKAGLLPKNGKLTVERWLRHWYATRMAAGVIRATTAKSYREHIECYLVPHLGRLKLSELRSIHIEHMFAHIRQDRAAKIRKVLQVQHRLDARAERAGTTAVRLAVPRQFGARTQQRVHATLRKALNDAVRKREIPFNAARDVEMPKARRPRVRPWDPAEYGAFLDAISGHRVAPMFHLAGHTGLRRGELLGLEWSDIDLAARILVVRRQITTVGYQVFFGKPKTKYGEDRQVYLDKGTVAMLRQWRRRQTTEKPYWTDANHANDWVFTRLDGSYWHPDRITKLFAQLIDQTGARRVRLHDLRHQAASLQLAAGIDIAIVLKMLGHSSVVTTVDTYVHLIPKAASHAADKAAAMVPRQRKPRPGKRISHTKH